MNAASISKAYVAMAVIGLIALLFAGHQAGGHRAASLQAASLQAASLQAASLQAASLQANVVAQTNNDDDGGDASGDVGQKREQTTEPDSGDEPSLTESDGPTLGVHVSEVNSALGKHLRLPPGVGLIVEHVVAGSAAANSGLRRFDVLHRFHDQLLVNREQLATLVRIHGSENAVTLTVIREGASTQVEAVPSKNRLSLDIRDLERNHSFDAFHYFHGQSGQRELQQCSLCHGASGADGQKDNYQFFHGEPGSSKLQDCSACHARVVHPLKVPDF